MVSLFYIESVEKDGGSCFIEREESVGERIPLKVCIAHRLGACVKGFIPISATGSLRYRGIKAAFI